MKSKPIVITAGFEKPDIASSTVKNPPTNKIVKTKRAVTSKLNFSVINKIKAKKIRPKTKIISKVIETNYLKVTSSICSGSRKPLAYFM